MIPEHIVVLYHSKCEASLNFIALTETLKKDIKIEYIDLHTDSIETEIKVDVVPLMILNNNSLLVFRGKECFEKITDIIENSKPNNSNRKKKGVNYNKPVKFIEDEKFESKKNSSNVGRNF